MQLLTFFKPTRTKAALLLPGAGFLLLGLILEPAAVKAALPGLLFLALLSHLVASTAVALRRHDACPGRFSRLLRCALFLIFLDQACKGLILNLLPLGWKRALIPGALSLTHVHNLQGSWIAVQFDLAFVGPSLLIAVCVLDALLALSLYRYYAHRRRRPSLWARTALVGLVAGLGSAFIDLALRGFTVDYLGVAGLVVADLKDFYINFAFAALLGEIAENWQAAREMSTRQSINHLQQALRLSMHELAEPLKSWLERKRSGQAM